MSFLANREIKSRHKALFLSGFDEKYVKQASYDLRLGDEIYIVGHDAPEKLTDRNPYISIPPGQFAILTTFEEVSIPRDLLALIAVRTRFKFQGLINISGFHVDPTFQGKLLFAVQNVGPSDIRLKFLEPTFSIFFSTLTSSEVGEDRNDQQEVEYKRLKGIRLQDVQLLGGSSLTLSKLQHDVNQLRTIVLIYGSFAVAATVALIIALLKK
jgi:dCTP deaminase